MTNKKQSSDRKLWLTNKKQPSCKWNNEYQQSTWQTNEHKHSSDTTHINEQQRISETKK